MSHLMSYDLAQKTVLDYLCAHCRGHLQFEHIETDSSVCEVHCADPDCVGDGFVTKEYVRAKREKDYFDYLDAMSNIGNQLGIKRDEMTPEQALSDLGF